MRKPRLGKKGRKALAAKKAAPRKKVKAKAPISEPCPDTDCLEAEQPAAPETEQSGVGDGCAVGGSGPEVGPEFNPA